MMRGGARRLVIVLLAAGFASGATKPITKGEDLSNSGAISIGLVHSLFRDVPDSMIPVVMRPFQTLMESQTGLTGRLVPASNALELGRSLHEDKILLGVFHGFEFAWAQRKYPDLKPLLIVINHQQHLHACVLVHSGASVTRFADLKGMTLALPRRTREHCHLFLDRRCQMLESTPAQFFHTIYRPASIEDSIDQVVNGKVHAVIVDSVFLNWYRARKPARFARLKVVEQSEVFPAAVIAYHARRKFDAVLNRFREGMLRAHQTDRGQRLLTLCQITSCESIPADYEQLLAEIVKAYPLPPNHLKDEK